MNERNHCLEAGKPIFEPLEPRVLLDAAPLGDAEDAGRTVIYVTIPSQESGGEFAAGGVYRSTDRGETWEWAMGTGINTEIGLHPWGASDIDQFWFLDQAQNNPDIIYVTNKGTGYDPPYHYTVYRSDNAGDTWDDVFFNDPRFAENNTDVGWLFYAFNRGWGGTALGFAVNPGDPTQLMYTNYGEVIVTNDSGGWWTTPYSDYADGQSAPTTSAPGRWQSIGIEDTTCWYYAFDPHDPNRTYIAYTDIGFARSEDRSDTWYPSSDGIDWSNTIYDLALDPDVPGLMFAACSNQHDIPHWSSQTGDTAAGGLAKSTDYGETWTSLYNGLPSAPVTSVYIDPASSVGSRTIYVTVYGHGVYKSTNGGNSWSNKSSGITPTDNLQAYNIDADSNGDLLVTVIGRRPGNGVTEYLTGGIYKSTNGGDSWMNIGDPGMWRPVDFAVHPTNPDIIYVAAMDGFGRYGGVYKTTNGGGSWTRSVPDFDTSIVGWIEGFSVALNPDNPDIVYFTSGTHGMFISYDAGATWNETDETNSPAFRNVQRITWDPLDHDVMYMSTFGGGIWTGPDPATVGAGEWTCLGMGGGGGFFYPNASPHDPNLIFVSSDMSGFYRSTDGGQRWTMIDWRTGTQYTGDLVFHPTDPNDIFALPYRESGDDLIVSYDAGITWDEFGGSNPLWNGENITAFAMDEVNPDLMILSTDVGLYRTTDGGGAWSEISGTPDGLMNIYIDPTSPANSRVILAANADAPWRSDDGGLTWAEKSNGLPWADIRAFSAGADTLPWVTLSQVNGGDAQRAAITSVSFTLSEPVTGLDIADLMVWSYGMSAQADLSALTPADVTWDVQTNTVTFDLSAVSLPDGNYGAFLSGTGIVDATNHMLDGNRDGVGGDSYEHTFFARKCDADGDGLVDGSDLGIWQQNYDPLGVNVNSPGMGDFNLDGLIDGGDLALWQQNYDPLGTANQPPVLEENSGVSMAEGSTVTIDETMLLVTDGDNSASQLTYILESVPLHGYLLLDGAVLFASDTFTQQDIADALLTYEHDGSDTTSDDFVFNVSDGFGGVISSSAFQITVSDPLVTAVVTTDKASYSVGETVNWIISVYMGPVHGTQGISLLAVNLTDDHGETILPADTELLYGIVPQLTNTAYGAVEFFALGPGGGGTSDPGTGQLVDILVYQSSGSQLFGVGIDDGASPYPQYAQGSYIVTSTGTHTLSASFNSASYWPNVADNSLPFEELATTGATFSVTPLAATGSSPEILVSGTQTPEPLEVNTDSNLEIADIPLLQLNYDLPVTGAETTDSTIAFSRATHAVQAIQLSESVDFLTPVGGQFSV